MKSTKDLYLASAFLSLGAEYNGVDKTDSRHMIFHFLPRKVSTGELSKIDVPTQDLDDIETQWVNGNLLVNAVAFADAIKRMKSVVHSTD